MAFEPFTAASGAGKAINILLLLFLFLSWVSTMVTFGGTMMTATTTIGGISNSFDYTWNKVKIGDITSDITGSCQSGGQATLAFAVFAFLAFLIHIPIVLARIIGFNFPGIRDPEHSLNVELALTCLEWFCFFIQVCVYGGACFTPARDHGTATGKGFGLMLACFFFLLICIAFYGMMRSNSNYALGNGSARAGTSTYGGGGSEDSGYVEQSGQPTFSYQGPENGGSTL